MTFPFIFISCQEHERPIFISFRAARKKIKGFLREIHPQNLSLFLANRFCDIFYSSLRCDKTGCLKGQILSNSWNWAAQMFCLFKAVVLF